jgi:hypothetical protein
VLPFNGHVYGPRILMGFRLRGEDYMLRRIGSVAGCALLFSGLLAVPAVAKGSTAARPSGELSCGLDGTFAMSQPLPNATSEDGAPRPIKVKITAKLSACAKSGVAGNEAAVTGGSLTATGVLDAGSSCADIADATAPDFTFEPKNLDVTWTSTSAAGRKRPVVGKSKTTIFSTGETIFGGWEYWSDTFGDQDAFAGGSATLDLMVEDAYAVFACTRGLSGATGPVNLGVVKFSAARGSRISVSS